MTWARLADMAHAKRADEWDRTSTILALLHNQNRRKGAPAAKPSEFNPLADPQPGESEPAGSRRVGRPGSQEMTADFHRAMFDALKKKG